jgi:hypothetical protein
MKVFADRYEEMFKQLNNHKSVNPDQDENYLNFDDFTGTLIILLIGYVLALLAFILEWICALVKKFI